jgi:hypothetical protein
MNKNTNKPDQIDGGQEEVSHVSLADKIADLSAKNRHLNTNERADLRQLVIKARAGNLDPTLLKMVASYLDKYPSLDFNKRHFWRAIKLLATAKDLPEQGSFMLAVFTALESGSVKLQKNAITFLKWANKGKNHAKINHFLVVKLLSYFLDSRKKLKAKTIEEILDPLVSTGRDFSKFFTDVARMNTASEVEHLVSQCNQNYQPELPRQEAELIARNKPRFEEISAQSKELEAQLDEVKEKRQVESEKPKADYAEVQKLDDQIVDLEKKLSALDDEFEELMADTKEASEFERAFFELEERRFTVIERLTREFGFDINLKGQEIDFNGHRAEIVGLRFEGENPNVGPNVTIRDQNGKLYTFKTDEFRDLINSNNGVANIETVEALNEHLHEHLAFSDLEVGMNLQTEKLVDDQFSKKIAKQEANIKVTNITGDQIQFAHILADELSAPETMDFSNFANFVLTNNFRRSNLSVQQTQAALEKSRERSLFGRLIDKIKGEDKEKAEDKLPALNLPQDPNEEKLVYYYHDGSLRQGILRQKVDPETSKVQYEIEPVFMGVSNTEALYMAGVPGRLASASKLIHPNSQTLTLEPWDILNLHTKGGIMEVPQVLHGEFFDDEMSELEAERDQLNGIDSAIAKLKKAKRADEVALANMQIRRVLKDNNIKFKEADFPTLIPDLDSSSLSKVKSGSRKKAEELLKNKRVKLERRAAEKNAAFSSNNKFDIGGSGGGSTASSSGSSFADQSSFLDRIASQVSPPPAEGGRPKFREDVLPFNAVGAKGSVLPPRKASYLKSLWQDTTFLSVSDLFEMGKTMWEYYDRRFLRKQKARFAELGQYLPYFGQEMQRIATSAESEEVEQFKSNLAEIGPDEVLDRFAQTRNKDELKACLLNLSERGYLRFDDVEVWKRLNAHAPDDAQIPIPKDGNPYTVVDDAGLTGFEYIKNAIDNIWDQGFYATLYSQNKSTAQSNVDGAFAEGKELESITGGHARALGNMLRAHMNGEFVDAHRFEGLIGQSIVDGKSSMEAKMYYMIMGIGLKNSQGRTIMPFARLASMAGNYLGNMPWFDYFTGTPERPEEPGADTSGSYKVSNQDVEDWAQHFFENRKNPANFNDIENFQPSQVVTDFKWNSVLSARETLVRVKKLGRSADGIDHDDFYAFLPLYSETMIGDICQSQSGGAGKRMLTVEGYKNGFPGFSQFLRTFSKQGRTTQLREIFKSYFKFEAIMTKRYKQEQESYQRLGQQELETSCVASSTPPISFIHEINTLLDAVIDAYSANGANTSQIKRTITLMRQKADLSRSDGPNHQKQIDKAIEEFGEQFTNLVATDNGLTMISTTRDFDDSGKLRGMVFVDDAEKDRRKTAAIGKYELADVGVAA